MRSIHITAWEVSRKTDLEFIEERSTGCFYLQKWIIWGIRHVEAIVPVNNNNNHLYIIICLTSNVNNPQRKDDSYHSQLQILMKIPIKQQLSIYHTSESYKSYHYATTNLSNSTLWDIEPDILVTVKNVSSFSVIFYLWQLCEVVTP